MTTIHPKFAKLPFFSNSLNDSVLDSELLKGYSIFRKDRVERNGGGVLVAVKDTISVKRRFDLEDNSIELVVVELSQINNQSIILYTYYRPPGSPLDDIQQLSSSLANIPESSCVLLVGDFNLPAIDWSFDQPSPSNVGGHLEDKFFELFADYFLEQLIPGPTHRGGNKLDLLLCNCPEIIKRESTSSPEQSGFPTDHHILVFKIQKLISRAKSIRRTVFDYRRGNFEHLRKSLSNSPFDGTPPENIDEHWSRWKEWFLMHVDNFIPVKLVMDTNSPPWIDGEVRHFIRKKYAALKKFRQSKFRQSNFSSVFTPSRPNTHLADANNSIPLRTDQTLSDVTINVNEISECLNVLDTSKACGPDGIPSRLLKECHQQIAPSLYDVFNHSLVSGRVPSEWKSANITPIHKKKQKEPAENYRPISLLPIISKVMERCVYSRLYQHVLHLISPHQHGFLRKRSCVTQLLSSFHSIGQKLDKNTQTDILYLDFAKAFDSVDHSILLGKLKAYGVSGRLLDWFSDYLNNRQQRVVVDGVASQWTPVTSGVPQGSILGPILFVIFINDVPKVVENGTMSALFTDDTKVYRTITSVSDCDQLQQALTNLDVWSSDNNITFNALKCKVLSVTRKKTPISYVYCLG